MLPAQLHFYRGEALLKLGNEAVTRIGAFPHLKLALACVIGLLT